MYFHTANAFVPSFSPSLHTGPRLCHVTSLLSNASSFIVPFSRRGHVNRTTFRLGTTSLSPCGTQMSSSLSSSSSSSSDSPSSSPSRGLNWARTALHSTLQLLSVSTFAFFLLSAHPLEAATNMVKLPPIDRTDATRCQPSSSAIGQANAARDKLVDLRECDLRGMDFSSYDLSGALISNANVNGANFKDAQLSKSYAPNAKFRDVDFTNAVVDRVTFDNADLTNAIFSNAVLSDSTFENAVLENVDFTDVYVGDFAQRSMCKNPTAKGTNPKTGAPTRESLGCRR